MAASDKKETKKKKAAARTRKFVCYGSDYGIGSSGIPVVSSNLCLQQYFLVRHLFSSIRFCKKSGPEVKYGLAGTQLSGADGLNVLLINACSAAFLTEKSTESRSAAA